MMLNRSGMEMKRHFAGYIAFGIAFAIGWRRVWWEFALVLLAGLGAGDVTLLVRDPARAAKATALGRDLGLAVGVQLLGESIEQFDLVANTIPAAATAPHAEALAAAAGAVFDVVYDPWPTPLGQAAQLRGIPGLNGLDLLAGQAVDQFFLLTGAEVSYDLCRSAAGRELSRRAAL